MSSNFFHKRLGMLSATLPEPEWLSHKQAVTLLHFLLNSAIELCEQFNIEPELVKYLRKRPRLLNED